MVEERFKAGEEIRCVMYLSTGTAERAALATFAVLFCSCVLNEMEYDRCFLLLATLCKALDSLVCIPCFTLQLVQPSNAVRSPTSASQASVLDGKLVVCNE